MKHSAFKKMLSAMLALVLCIGMVPAAAIPAAAASSVGSNEWVVRNDDFSSYTTGTDTFWENDWYGGFSNSYHSYTLAEGEDDPEGTIYGPRGSSSYNIVEEANGNKYLELVSVDMCGTRITLPTISGAYSMTMDLYMPKSTGSSVPGVILNLGYKGQVYIDGGDGVRLMGVGLTSPDYYVKDGEQKMPFALDTWYTVKMSMEPGRFIVKFWLRDGQEPEDNATAGVFVFEDETDLTAEKLSSDMTPSIRTRSRGTQTAIDSNEYIVRLDNLEMAKPYDTMTLPTNLSGEVGQVLSAIPTFTGQDLMAQQPKPKFSYTVDDSTLGRATPGGYLALNGAGTGTVTAELLTIDGESTGATADADLNVTASTAAEQPLRILSIGNDYSRDTLYYVDELAALLGKNVESAYLSMTDATLRYHAHNVAMNTADYSYYADASGDTAVTSTINDVVEGERWDIIMLQQGGAAVGMNNTFAGDLRYLLDYLADAQPNAEVYWNMNAAQGSDDILANYYDNSQNVMYNAIVGCVDMFIAGEDAQYADDFVGWFPVGAAIQKLREAKDDTTLTSETENGRLAAAMTVLKVLFPEAELDSITAENLGITDADLDLIRQSAEAACANLSAAPAKLAVSPETIETASGDSSQVTVGQTDAPLNLRFADIVVTKDGTVYAGAYESVTHVPARETLHYTEYCPEGYGRLKIWKGSADGKSWDFDNPILTIDQQELQDWGISPNLYNRYDLLKTGVQDYAFLNDARDANLGLMYYDMDGNGTEDEVLLFTFFCKDYNESGTSTFTGTYLMYYIVADKTWSEPQRISSEVLGGGGKRGDIAVFSDGQILFPMYASPKVSGVLLQWNVTTQHWDTVYEAEIPMAADKPTTEFTEPSFIAPDPDGNTVYGFVRDNGQAVISYDRGLSWELIHIIDGEVLQPGWAYIDENRAFATWAFVDGGIRPTKGQMVYFDAGWEATQPVLIHEHYNRTPRDTGDPSSKLLQNGKLLAITYDTAFHSIVGKFLDPDAEQFLLPEMNDDAANVHLQTVPGATDLTVNELPNAYTLDFTAAFNNSSSTLTVTASNGAVVELKVGEYGIKSTKNDYQVRIAVTNGVTYVKAWREGYLAPDWTAVEGGTSTNSGKAVFVGSGVTLGDVTVTRSVTMTMGEGGANTAGMGIVAPLQLNPADMADQVIWDTSDADVATVDDQGNISFVGMGNVTITATLGDKTVSADYTVGEATGEVTGAGEKKVIFEDDFESYTAGDNTFYKAMTSSGYTVSDSYAKTGYNIIEEENGNQYLELVGQEGKANYPWVIVSDKIFGDYTVQLDFKYDVGAIFFNMWQGNEEEIYSMVQIGTDHFNFQYTDSETGNYINSPEFYSHESGVWNTIKVARVDGGMYAKVWPTGTSEPANWQYNMMADEMNTDNTVQFRMSYSVQEEDSHKAFFDNLIITKQTISDVGDKEWIVRDDDFEDRTVGQDTFWNDSKYSGFSSSYHTLTEGSLWWTETYNSEYNIIQEDDNKMVELVSTYKVANYFKTADNVTGAYSATMDLYMPDDAYYATDTSKVPGVILDPFVGSDLAGVLPIYIDGKDGVRLRESVSTGAAQDHYITDANEIKMPFNLDSWYTVKVAVAPGQIMVKMWAKGEQEPANDAAAGVLVFAYDGITQALLNKGMAFSLATRARSSTDVSPTVRLDNLKIAKPYKSLSLPAQLSGAPGDIVTLAPKFVGQDLADQTPVPTIRYTSSNTAVAGVTTAGEVTYGDVGETTISVELLDIDGESHGVAHEISVIVAEATEPEPEPDDPSTGLEPEPDPEPETLRGTFSLQVVNTIIINGEEVQICRWVWTPYNEQ